MKKIFKLFLILSLVFISMSGNAQNYFDDLKPIDTLRVNLNEDNDLDNFLLTSNLQENFNQYSYDFINIQKVILENPDIKVFAIPIFENTTANYLIGVFNTSINDNSSCNKSSSNLQEKNSICVTESNPKVESSLTDYFTDVELVYINQYFGKFDMSKVIQKTLEDGTKIIVVFSENNNEFSLKKLIVSEKVVSDIKYVKKEIFSVSSTAETINEVIEKYPSPNLYLSREIVNINVGILYSIATDDEITEVDLGFNEEAKPFGPCFKSCYAAGIRTLGHNFAVAVICSLNIPECIAGISAACTWDCLF